MRRGKRLVIGGMLLSIAAAGLNAVHAAPEQPLLHRTENVIFVVLDGFRYQDFFTGADEALIDRDAGGVREPADLRHRYWRDSPRQRREVLLPYIWGTIAREGQIFGDPEVQSSAKTTNGRQFSYPGYNEMFCGFGDPRIDSNAKRNNPNLSVLEFLQGQAKFRDRVAAFCTWDAFPFIFRSSTSGLLVHAGWVPIQEPQLNERQRQANEMMARLPRYWPDNVFDVVTMDAAREHLLRHKPHVMFIGFGETDEWGHGRRYDLYLDAARNADRYLAELWTTLQQLPEYQDRTTLIITTDHGRGPARDDWTDHGENVPGAEFIWIAIMGPDTPARGVRERVDVTQGQLAATVARLLGEDFNGAAPQAAPPLPDVIGQLAAPR